MVGEDQGNQFYADLYKRVARTATLSVEHCGT